MSKFKYYDTDEIASSEKYPFSKGQIRHHLLYRKENGLQKAVLKIGKRLYLREDLFDEWMNGCLEIIDEPDSKGEK